MVIAGMELQPDYSWSDTTLSGLCGGILAVCLVIAVGALAIGALRWTATHVTRTLVDDPHGDAIIIACLIGSLLLGSLSAAAGWGIDNWGKTSVATSSGTLSADGTDIDTALGATSEISQWIDDLKNSIAADISAAADSIKNAVGSLGTSIKNWWNEKKEWVDKNAVQPFSSDSATENFGAADGSDKGSGGGTNENSLDAAIQEGADSAQDSWEAAGRCFDNHGGAQALACAAGNTVAAGGKQIGTGVVVIGGTIDQAANDAWYRVTHLW